MFYTITTTLLVFTNLVHNTLAYPSNVFGNTILPRSPGMGDRILSVFSKTSTEESDTVPLVPERENKKDEKMTLDVKVLGQLEYLDNYLQGSSCSESQQLDIKRDIRDALLVIDNAIISLSEGIKSDDILFKTFISSHSSGLNFENGSPGHVALTVFKTVREAFKDNLDLSITCVPKGEKCGIK